MALRSKWRVLFLVGLGTFMVTQYQNCAPVQNQGSGSSPSLMSSAANGGGTVDIIDHNNGKTDLSFTAKSVAIPNTAPGLILQGQCSQFETGAVLHWELLDPNQQTVKEGFVNCENGTFNVVVEMDDSIQCDQNHLLIARLGLGQMGIVTVTRRCSSSGSTVAAQPPGDQCFYQRESGSDGMTTRCSQICYHGANIDLDETIDLNQCANL